MGLCSFTAHTFLNWHTLGKSSFVPPTLAGLVSQAAPLTPTDGDLGGQVCQRSSLDGVNTATKGKAPALSSLFHLILTVHLPYSITASSMTVKSLNRQNVIQHQGERQENRMGHQEGFPTSPQPSELPKG